VIAAGNVQFVGVAGIIVVVSVARATVPRKHDKFSKWINESNSEWRF